MAWNEPGGSGDKDPWGGRNNEQGPPDIDEVVRKMQDRFGKLFGGGRSGAGGGSTGGGFGGGSVGLLGIVVLLAWGLSGIYIIDEGIRGVVLQFGAYKETTMPGPHWYPRFIQSVEKVNVDRVQSIELGYVADEALMLTQDENIIDIKFEVQYQLKDARDYLFNVRSPDETMRDALESAVREIIGKSEMDFVITGGRSEVVNRAQVLLQEILDSYKTGLQITSVNMLDAQPPQQVQAAFSDAVKAREDEQRLKNEAETYANEILPRARGESARILEEANAYKEQVIAEAEGETSRFLKILAEYEKAPEVTHKRLYIDAMQSVLTHSSKVIVDTKSGNNLLYLPLDKLMQRDQPREVIVTTPTTSANHDSTGRQSSANDQMRQNLRRREVR